MVLTPATAQEGAQLRGAIKELQGLKFSVVVGAATDTNIAVTGILTEDTLIGVVRLNRDSTAANIDMLDVLSETSITSNGNIQLDTTTTTGDKLMVVWMDKN